MNTNVRTNNEIFSNLLVFIWRSLVFLWRSLVCHRRFGAAYSCRLQASIFPKRIWVFVSKKKALFINILASKSGQIHFPELSVKQRPYKAQNLEEPRSKLTVPNAKISA